jgi:anti-anti-sigma factor
MGEASTVDLFDGWRATVEPCGVWLCVRLHPPEGPGQFRLADGLWNEIHSRGAKQVVLEMDEVSFFSSALMSELVRLHKRIAMGGGRLRLSGLQEHPHEAMHMLRLDEVLTVYADRAAALQ